MHITLELAGTDHQALLTGNEVLELNTLRTHVSDSTSKVKFELNRCYINVKFSTPFACSLVVLPYARLTKLQIPSSKLQRSQQVLHLR